MGCCDNWDEVEAAAHWYEIEIMAWLSRHVDSHGLDRKVELTLVLAAQDSEVILLTTGGTKRSAPRPETLSDYWDALEAAV